MCQTRIDPRRFRLLDALTEPQLLLLRRVARLSHVPRRQRIYSVGDTGDRVFFLDAGVVKVAVPQRDGPEILLAFLYPGDVFGESALIDSGPRDHAAEAHEDAKVWSVGRTFFDDLLGHSPALAYALFRLMARGARRFRMRVEELLQKDAQCRVARTLLNLAAERSVADADGLLIPLRLTQADLANMTGLARETVNNVLGGLRAGGLVEMTRDSIRIRRPNALRSVGPAIPHIRREVEHEHEFHAHHFGGASALGADARRVDRDARHAVDGGAGRAALGARSQRV